MSLSKLLSGSGGPLSIVLMRPELDVWNAGEHSGTFRANSVAFVSAVAMFKMWSDRQFTAAFERTADKLQEHFDRLVKKYPNVIKKKRGRGLMAGLKCCSQEVVRHVHDVVFQNGLLIEASGLDRDVIKVLPPITISDHELDHAMSIFGYVLQEQGHDD